MGHQKITKKAIPSENLVKAREIKKFIANLLNHSQDGIIAFDPSGKVIAINDQAALLFGQKPKKLINHYLWQHFKDKSLAQKRQFAKARASFRLAQDGVTQQSTWLEIRYGKPVLAYNIMINKAEIHGSSVIFAKLSDILQSKLTEWVLWSLSTISNQHEINGVIDEILKLASDVFGADYAAVCLIDNQRIAHSVSYFIRGEKAANISYPMAGSPCNKIIREKSIFHLNNIQRKFPKNTSLKDMEVHSYVAGPLFNAQQDVVGLMNISSKESIPYDKFNSNLFQMFLGRINLEIERLLNQRKLQFLASIPQQDPNPVLRLLPSGEIIFANNQGKVILKDWSKEYSGLPGSILKEARKAQTTNKVVRVELEAENKTYLFTLIWIEEFQQINIYGTDISQLKNTEQNMLNLARFDALTQIANRQYFEEKLKEKIHEHHLESQTFALLLIDLDNFKIINDTLGHPIGDRLLKAATKRMVRCLRQVDFIARLGGDEFIVIVNQSNTATAVMVAEKIISVLARRFQFGEYNMTVTASIGIALYPDSGVSTSDLLKHADIAMYQAKKAGKNSYAVFSKLLHFVQDKRNEILRKDIKLAPAKDQLYVEYQPQIELTTNRIIGFEALLRWIHPLEGLILPSEFIPIAEQTGCIHILSQWLIERSLEDFTRFMKADPLMKLSINVSLSQLSDARFIDSLNDNLLEYKICKNKIILDISERVIAPHYKQICKSMKRIHNIGVKICLDNFGSPQVSLPKLLFLPLDYLKLDPNLLCGIERNPKHRLLLKGIMYVAQELNIKLIQKGIETVVQHEILKTLGCPYAQGYFYCRPLRINELQGFIKDYSQTFK